MIHELDCVALTVDLPAHGLRHGDVGAVVLVHARDAAYEVEFVSTSGETVALVTLSPAQVRLLSQTELASSRPVEGPDRVLGVATGSPSLERA
jgi:hypothetical protein